MFGNWGWGRCRREHHTGPRVYRDEYATGVCVLGFFVERLHG